MMVQYARRNALYIISYNLANDNVDALLKFDMYFARLKNEKISNDMRKDLNKFTECLYSQFKDARMFMFENWQDKFEDYQKLSIIELTNKYDCLDISKINEMSVLSLLKKIDFDNDIFCDIYEIINSYRSNINFMKQNIYLGSSFMTQYDLSITSYYPIFKAISRIMINGKITNGSKNTLQFLDQ
jgi:hypothetical protein